MVRALRTLLTLSGMALALGPGTAAGAVYDVGPGQPLATIGAVPWASLGPGDLVRIHWRAEPYREKWVIARRGTAEAPIVVQGVRGPGGERPVISGDGAVTPLALSYWNDARGVIKIGGSSVPADTLPAYIRLEGLEVRSARPGYTFTDDGGNAGSYSNNAAAVYVEKAEHLEIVDCELHDSGNGLFIGANDGATRHIRIARNRIHSNGIEGRFYEHNAYTAAIDIVYEGNRFGPLRPGADGNNLKDRSAGLVVRTNWIEGGNRQLDLVDAEDSAVLVNHPSYGETHVYGNVLIEPDGDGNSQIVHYGGDSGSLADYRKGTLHLYNNTVISERSGNTTLLRLSTNEEHAKLRNNVVYVTAPGSRLALLDASGVLTLDHNWLKVGYVSSHGTLQGTITDLDSITGSDPGFVNEAVQDYRPAAASPLVDGGTVLAPAVLPEHPLDRQYVPHLAIEPRPTLGALDLGAFERDALFADDFESGTLDAWSGTDRSPSP